MELENANVEYLYHYTSVDSLALILKNRTIRLNPLDKMDDLQEKKTKDIENFGKFFFVSSWTSEEQESIPMWKMYTSQIMDVLSRLSKGKMTIDKKSTVWTCEDCGYKLSADEFEDNYVFWFCDECQTYLNNQEGFDRNAVKHICRNCGYENDTTFENVK